MSPRSQSLQAAETRAQKAAFSVERLPSSRFGRVPAPALTSPKKAAHRRTVMNQRSMLSARPLLREPTTASGSFSAGASAWRSLCPAAGAPAPQGSSSSSIVAAPEQRSRYPSASQRSLGNSAPCPGLVPPEPAVPAGATSPGVALVRAEESSFGTRRPSQAAAARPPSRRPQLFQILKNDAVKVLYSICQQIWKTQQWPQGWNRSVFTPIPKKGNAKECSNYHTITLISHASKVMLKILQATL